MKQHL